MSPVFMVAVIAATGAALFPLCEARAEAAREALLIANVNYAGQPPLPACARSTTLLSAALRVRGFEVTRRDDASIGGIDGAIGVFSRNASGRTAGFVYVCGYGTAFNDRLFLLPVSATLTRPSDVLNQGVLLKSMVNAVAGGNGTTAIVFDLVAGAEAPTVAHLEALATLPLSDSMGLIAASQGEGGDKATPLATALAAGLEAQVVRTDTLLAEARTRLTEGKVAVAAMRQPSRATYLAGEPRPPAPPPPPPAPVAAPVAPPVPMPVVAPPPPVPAASTVSFPDEARMTETDRLQVQKALLRLGYYALEADGRFGPETRAAIRRYQHEIGAELTGRLTAAQATRLVTTR